MPDNFYDNIMGEGEVSPTDSDVNTALANAGDEALAEDLQGQQAEEDLVSTDSTETIEEGAKKEESPTSEEDEGTKEKTLPYDQDPKWKAARAAEKNLNDILEKNGFETTEDLEAALDSGKSLKELLGNRDASTLIKDSDTLAKAMEKQNSDRQRKMEEEESQDETIARLKRDNADLRDFNRKQEDERLASIDTNNALSTFNERVSGTIDAEEGLSSPEKTILGRLLGVDNPIDDVDISDLNAVSKEAKTGITQFKDFVKSIKQSAIDEYAKGNSSITPITKAQQGGEVKTVQPKKMAKNATVDETFDAAKSELVEIFSNADAGFSDMFDD